MIREITHLIEEKNKSDPWLLYVTMKKERLKIYLDCEIIAEWIPNNSKCFKLTEIRLITNEDFTNQLKRVFRQFKHNLDYDDLKLIDKELNFMKEKLSTSRKVKLS